MNRNKVKFHYALYEGRLPILNEQGRLTGQYTVLYRNPVEDFANVSAAKGEIQMQQFGENESYDRVMVMDVNATSIDEYSILWVDVVPELNEDGSLAKDERGEVITPHDYVVKKVAKSLNSVSIAISKVTVRG